MDAVRVTRSGRAYKTPRASKSQSATANGKTPEQNCRKRLDKIWDVNKLDDLIIEEIKKQLSPTKTVKRIMHPVLSPVKTPKKTSLILPSIASPLRCLSLNSPNKGAAVKEV
jgi:hypothetical protein